MPICVHVNLWFCFVPHSDVVRTNYAGGIEVFDHSSTLRDHLNIYDESYTGLVFHVKDGVRAAQAHDGEAEVRIR